MIFDLQMFAASTKVSETGIQINAADKSVLEINSNGGLGAGTAWTQTIANGYSVNIGFVGKDGMYSGTTALAGAFGNEGVTKFINVSSTETWKAGEPAKITNISLIGTPLFASMTPFTIDINNGWVSQISLGSYGANLRLTNVQNNAIEVDDLAKTSDGRKIEFAGANTIKLSSAGEELVGTAMITNGKYSAELLQGSNIKDGTIQGKKNGSLVFDAVDTSKLMFGKNSDSVFVDMSDVAANGVAQLRGEDVDLITVDNLQNGGEVRITGLYGANNVIVQNAAGERGTVDIDDDNGKGDGKGVDTLSSVSIVGSEYTDWTANLIDAQLSGKGIEYVDLANHGAAVEATNWVFSNRTVDGAKGANVVSIGQHGVLDVEGGLYGDIDADDEEFKGIWDKDNDKSLLTAGHDTAVIGTHMMGSGDSDKTGETGETSVLLVKSAATTAGEAEALGVYEGVRIASQGKEYNALLTSNEALEDSMTGLAFGSYDIIVGSSLNLGDRTDKKVVYLNNGLDDSDWGETISYSANMTSVTSSSDGKSLIIGDFENKINFFGNGDQDSLYGGRSYNVGGYDTLASAGGRKAWMGTGIDSGLTKVELLHNGMQTYNFGFVGEDFSLQGGTVTGTETEDTADVLALMNGMGYRSLGASEHKRVNLSAGSDSSNNFTFQSISEGVHDIMYTWNLGKENYVARVDTSLGGSTSNFNYSDDVDFYLGFGDTGAPDGKDPVNNVSDRVHKTVLTLNSEDTGKMVNYGGKNVVVGLTTIDGSDAAGGNVLNGQQNYAEYIIASDKVGDTLCGGVASDSIYIDTADDTLVGGDGADVFWVGAGMGDDVINNITDGDTIIFLGSKFADVELNYEYDRMETQADSHWMEVNFSDEAGGASIKLTPGDGVTDHLHEVKDVTAVFDDATFVWDGSTWTKSSQA